MKSKTLPNQASEVDQMIANAIAKLEQETPDLSPRRLRQALSLSLQNSEPEVIERAIERALGERER